MKKMDLSNSDFFEVSGNDDVKGFRKAASSYAQAARAASTQAAEAHNHAIHLEKALLGGAVTRRKHVEKAMNQSRVRALQQSDVARVASNLNLHAVRMASYRFSKKRARERSDIILKEARAREARDRRKCVLANSRKTQKLEQAVKEARALVSAQKSNSSLAQARDVILCKDSLKESKVLSRNLSVESKKHRVELEKSKKVVSAEETRKFVSEAQKSAAVATERSSGAESVRLAENKRRTKFIDALFRGPCLLEDGPVERLMQTLRGSLMEANKGYSHLTHELFRRSRSEDNCEYVARVANIDPRISIKKQVGQGANGSVFFGVPQRNPQERWAIKLGILNKHKVDNFWYAVHTHQEIFESLQSSRVRVPQMRGAHTLSSNSKVYAGVVLMSYENAVNVRKVLKTSGREESILRKFAKALRYMHESGFAHGDPHVGNFMESHASSGEIVIVDFDRSANLARLIDVRRVRDAIKYDVRMAFMSLKRTLEEIYPETNQESKLIWAKWTKAFADSYTYTTNASSISFLNYTESVDVLSNKYRHEIHAQDLYKSYYTNVLNSARYYMKKEKRERMHIFENM